MTDGRRRLFWRLGLSLGFAAAFVWWLGNQGVRLVPDAREFDRVAVWAWPAYAATLLAFHFLRAHRWLYLLRHIADVPARKVIGVSLVGYVAILVFPLRTGELARPMLIQRHAGVPMSDALGTVAVERVLDGVAVSLCLTVCLLVLPVQPGPYLWPLRLVPLGVFLASLAVLLLFLRRTERTIAWVGRLAGRVSTGLGERLTRALHGMARGLGTLPDRSALARFLGVSLLFYLSNVVGIWLLAEGCGLDLGFAEAVGVMGVLSVGILLPAGPGFFGSFQASVLVALGFFLPAAQVAERASVFIFTLYAGQVVFTLLLGLAAFLATRVTLGGIAGSELAHVAAADIADWT